MRLIVATFSSYGSFEPSNMTDVKPARTQRIADSKLDPWSR